MSADDFATDGTQYEFAMGEVYGVRAWTVHPNGIGKGCGLHSLSWASTWAPGVNTARCFRRKKVHLGDRQCDCGCNAIVPQIRWDDDPCSGMDPACECGFYAYLDGSENDYLVWQTGPTVQGVIRAFGKVILGTKGFRAEKAEILAMVPAEASGDHNFGQYPEMPEILERLQTSYPGIPIFKTKEAMLREFPVTPPEQEDGEAQAA